MEKVMVMKEFGEITESVREKLTSSAPYLSEKETCFNGAIDKNKIKKLKIDHIIQIKSVINTMIQEVIKNEEDVIKKLMEILKDIQSRSGLIELVNTLIYEYSNYTLNNNFNSTTKNIIDRIKLELQDNPDVVISIVVKKIIFTYFYNIVFALDKKQINELENAKLSGVEMDYILNIFGVTFNETSKNNGVYRLSKKVLNDIIDIVFDEKQKHLCWENCANAHPFECDKVTNIIKKRIDKYDFITDGYQIYDEKGKLDKFIVTKCTNYREEKHREMTPEELASARKAKRSIFMSYYDTDTVEEAKAIQKYISQKQKTK